MIRRLQMNSTIHSNPPKKQVYILPGYLATPKDHWFPWLAEKIQSTGAAVKIIEFTHPEQPVLEQWQVDLKQQIQHLDAHSIVIAHSLGCVSSLVYLSKALKDQKLHGLICVAGFYEKLSALPQLNEYIQQTHFDDGLLRTHIQQRYVFFSNNDGLVPAPLSIRFGQMLNAQMAEVKQAGHFMGQDGYTQFPQLWERVESLLKSMA